MIKGSVFLAGIASGTVLGVNLREQGWAAGLTRAYYAFKNEDIKKKIEAREKVNIDELYKLYYEGKLDGEDLNKFRKVVYSKKYDNLDELNLNIFKENNIGDKNNNSKF